MRSDSDLITEQVNPSTTQIDKLRAREIVDLISAEDGKIVPAIAQELDQIALAIEVIADRLSKGGRLIYVGAGTSGRLGVLDAAECPPSYSVPRDMVIGLIAGGPRALMESAEAAEDHPEIGRRDVEKLEVGPKDVVVGITASGRSPYVIGAVDEARARGSFTVSLTCNRRSPLAKVVHLEIAPVVGPEVILGSTRMKAGTAQKMVLNMLSTGAMILLGKTYGNLMVDIQASNEKLRERAIRIVSLATSLRFEEAQLLLNACAGEVKTAVVVSNTGITPDEARQFLTSTDGRLRIVLEQLNKDI